MSSLFDDDVLDSAPAVAAGAVRTMPRYAPHLMLTYDKHRLEPIRWTVCSFALVRSHFGEGVHEPLRQWDLHDAGGAL